jgi:hypothetical protein
MRQPSLSRTKLLVAISWPSGRISRHTTIANPLRPTTHSPMQRTRGASGWRRMARQLAMISTRSCNGDWPGCRQTMAPVGAQI